MTKRALPKIGQDILICHPETATLKNMPYAKSTLISLLACLVLGSLIAIAFRAGALYMTTDATHVVIGPFESTAPEFRGWMTHPGDPPWYKYPRLNGKNIIGYSGFPFSSYTDCFIGGIDNGVMYRSLQAGCLTRSQIGEFSIFFNMLFWSTSFFCLWLLFLGLRVIFYGERRSGI